MALSMYIWLSKQKVVAVAASVVKGIQTEFFRRMIFELMLGDLFLQSNLM